MDPICKCGQKIDSRRDLNVEEIKGGIGDKGYKVAIVYCEKCQNILGVIPAKAMLKDYIKEALLETKSKKK
ncbi:MAG: hypothetical protein GF364_00645 [Candidatus Lokiarchaeota archaeon]|nr:hypothetical protein [Candidatus Lokiarchaeota archaeon]